MENEGQIHLFWSGLAADKQIETFMFPSEVLVRAVLGGAKCQVETETLGSHCLVDVGRGAKK